MLTIHYRPLRRYTGFTAVEMLLVLIILGLLASIVVPIAVNDRKQAIHSSLAANVVQVQMMIDYHHHMDEARLYPGNIDPDWFGTGSLPLHPAAMPNVPLLEVASGAPERMQHPRNKIIVPGSQGAYWYNPTNGAFRARITFQGSNEETLATYNEINHSDLAGMGDTLGPAGMR